MNGGLETKIGKINSCYACPNLRPTEFDWKRTSVRLPYRVAGVGQPKFWEGAKYFDFKWATVFCLGHRLSKHKMTRYTRNLGDMATLPPPMATTMSAGRFGWIIFRATQLKPIYIVLDVSNLTYLISVFCWICIFGNDAETPCQI